MTISFFGRLKPVEYFYGPTDYTAAEKKATEKQIESKSTLWAKKQGWYSRKWSSPGMNGVPDRIFIKNDLVVFVEFKRVRNTPTGLQCDEANSILQHGGIVYWTDTIRGLKEILTMHEVVK